MKKIIITISAVAFVLVNFSLNAQIQVDSDGQVKIFGNRESDDPNNDLSMQIYGPYGDYLANGKGNNVKFRFPF